MNVKRGLLRLWLFTSALWLISWAAYVWLSRIEGAEDTIGEHFLAFHTDFGSGWKAVSAFALGDYLSLAAIGIGIPLAVLIFGYSVWWVAAGFKRNNSSEAAENAKATNRMATDAAIEAAHLEELRFAKRQQWAVAIATITFIAGAFHMAHNAKPSLAFWEKLVATQLISIVVIGASGLLFKLQWHLRRTRVAIDPTDKCPWRRGADVVIGLVIVLVISAIAVCYSLWR